MSSMHDLQFKLYDTIDTVPAGAWESLRRGAADLATDRRLLRAFESTMTGQCRCWYAVIYDSQNAPLATACLCRFNADALETTGPAVQSATRYLRNLLPGFMKFGVLFCGLPVPSAASHLRIAPRADASAVLHCLHEGMTTLAKKTKSRLIVWKEFDEATADRVCELEQIGYIKGDVPPAYELRGGFDDIDDYLSALRSRYRRQIHESSAQSERHGATAEIFTGSDIAKVFDDHLHSLYRAVRDQAEFRLETLPREFFQSAACAFGDDASLVVMRIKGKALGFLFGLTADGEYHNLYVGLDYFRAKPAEIYFNLYTHDLDRVFRSGVTRIHLGQTSDDFKARLGAVGRPMFFYARALNPILHAGLERFAKLVFPPVPPPRTHDVFRAPEQEKIRTPKPEIRIKSE